MASKRTLNKTHSFFIEDVTIYGTFWPNGTGAPVTGSGNFASGTVGPLTGTTGVFSNPMDSSGKQGGLWTVTRQNTGLFGVTLGEKYNFCRSFDAWYVGPSGSLVYAQPVYADVATAGVCQIEIFTASGSNQGTATDLTKNQGCVQFMLVAGNSSTK